MTEAISRFRKLDWLLDDFASRVDTVRGALVLSEDGLPTGISELLPRDEAEQLAAVAAGLHSLAGAAGRMLGTGAARQTMVELEGGYLFVIAAGARSALAVLTAAGTDLSLVAYEMARLVRRVGDHLREPARAGE